MEEDENPAKNFDGKVPSWTAQERDVQPYYEGRIQELSPYAAPAKDLWGISEKTPYPGPLTTAVSYRQIESKRYPSEPLTKFDQQRQAFALTPLDKGFYDNEFTEKTSNQITDGNDLENEVDFNPPRKIRQNPNLSRTKTLVAENLDRLRVGLSHEDDFTDKPRHIHVLETADPSDSIYGVALIAALCIAVAMAIFGFAIGWYSLSKKAKAAADVDYPAYGVTGPCVDNSGDRKLAQSAHMYHYQHQKQQIIAMERNGMERRSGSMSEPESEEENEEGDYTVYECPGFASTGDIEVRNPLFAQDPTPTPGKCEIVKPQPQD